MDVGAPGDSGLRETVGEAANLQGRLESGHTEIRPRALSRTSFPSLQTGWWLGCCPQAVFKHQKGSTCTAGPRALRAPRCNFRAALKLCRHIHCSDLLFVYSESGA